MLRMCQKSNLEQIRILDPQNHGCARNTSVENEHICSMSPEGLRDFEPRINTDKKL